MVRIEMGALFLKFFLCADIDDRECRISDLSAHDVVDNPGTRYVVHVHKCVAESFLYCWFHNLLHEGIKVGIVELPGQETVIPAELPSLFCFVSIPSVQGETNVYRLPIG